MFISKQQLYDLIWLGKSSSGVALTGFENVNYFHKYHNIIEVSRTQENPDSFFMDKHEKRSIRGVWSQQELIHAVYHPGEQGMDSR